ncbi:MAG: FecR domain-containing protein [Rhizobiales bacterium]|nr:FecR domain-containing protein [Hyphomicrobiales bacterium]
MGQDATDPVVLEALEWFVRLRDHSAGDHDRRAFQAWIDADPSYAAAWAHAEALWKRFDIVQPEMQRLRRRSPPVSRRRVLGGIVLLAGAGTAYGLSRGGLFADHATDIGERRSVLLPDGSGVELGSYSALSLDFTQNARKVVLHRGEAFFDVAAEAGRSFVVAAANGLTEALGTRFDVKYVDDLVTVTVSDHAVLVRAAAAAPVRVERDWQVSYDHAGPGQVSEADLAVSGAWRQDRIVFQDVPLRRVLAELERYRRGRIILTDSRIGETPVTAIFDARQSGDALQVIADALPIRVLQASPYLAIVYPAR